VGGKFAGALYFNATNADHVYKLPNLGTSGTQGVTASAWIRAASWAQYQYNGTVFANIYWDGTNNMGIDLATGDNGRLLMEVGRAGGGFTGAMTDQLMTKGTWYHVAGTYDGTTLKAYINGILRATSTCSDGIIDSQGVMNIARNPLLATYFNGTIDDVRYYDRTLSDAEIGRLALANPNAAWAPNPSNTAINVALDTAIAWSPGDHAARHDVYFGTDSTSVLNANHSSSQFLGQIDSNFFGITTYFPSGLQQHSTYYWRIDEVNDTNVWKGTVWNFSTTGKLSIPCESTQNWTASKGAGSYSITTDACDFKQGSKCVRASITSNSQGYACLLYTFAVPNNFSNFSENRIKFWFKLETSAGNQGHWDFSLYDKTGKSLLFPSEYILPNGWNFCEIDVDRCSSQTTGFDVSNIASLEFGYIGKPSTSVVIKIDGIEAEIPAEPNYSDVNIIDELHKVNTVAVRSGQAHSRTLWFNSILTWDLTAPESVLTQKLEGVKNDGWDGILIPFELWRTSDSDNLAGYTFVVSECERLGLKFAPTNVFSDYVPPDRPDLSQIDSNEYTLHGACFQDTQAVTQINSSGNTVPHHKLRGLPATFFSTEMRQLQKDNADWFYAEFGNSPALYRCNGASVIVNEPPVLWTGNWNAPVWVDYSTSALNAWHQKWLPAQYATIAELNAKHGTSYTSFDQVPLPQPNTPITSLWYEFRDFIAWGYADYLNDICTYAVANHNAYFAERSDVAWWTEDSRFGRDYVGRKTFKWFPSAQASTMLFNERYPLEAGDAENAMDQYDVLNECTYILGKYLNLPIITSLQCFSMRIWQTAPPKDIVWQNFIHALAFEPNFVAVYGYSTDPPAAGYDMLDMNYVPAMLSAIQAFDANYTISHKLSKVGIIINPWQEWKIQQGMDDFEGVAEALGVFKRLRSLLDASGHGDSPESWGEGLYATFVFPEMLTDANFTSQFDTLILSQSASYLAEESLQGVIDFIENGGRVIQTPYGGKWDEWGQENTFYYQDILGSPNWNNYISTPGRVAYGRGEIVLVDVNNLHRDDYPVESFFQEVKESGYKDYKREIKLNQRSKLNIRAEIEKE
jgi:hypothetical protein